MKVRSTNPFTQWGFALLLAGTCFTLRADVTSIANPFSGDALETFEEFPLGIITTQPLTIFGGRATISGSYEFIWKTASTLGTPFGFGLGPFDAQAYDGTHGYGTSLAYGTTQITFSSPVTDFGGYWGSAVTPLIPTTFDFYGSGGTLIGTSSFTYSSPNNNGTLEWHGWHSDVPIYSMDYSGGWVVNDSLRLTLVPEPSSLALASSGTAMMIAWIYRKQRSKNSDSL